MNYHESGTVHCTVLPISLGFLLQIIILIFYLNYLGLKVSTAIIDRILHRKSRDTLSVFVNIASWENGGCITHGEN